jgi:glyoxylase-like metal-dependent hydrolase (beta-lactamase superfamily II)
MIPFRIPTTKAVFSLCARGEIERRGRLRYIINTEPHGDHWTGNAFFNIPLVAQEGVMTCILGTDLAAHVARVAPRVMQLNVANLYDYVTGAGIHAPR